MADARVRDECCGSETACDKSRNTVSAYTVSAAEQIAGLLDAKAVRALLGATASRFEVATVSTVVRFKPSARTLAIAVTAS